MLMQGCFPNQTESTVTGYIKLCFDWNAIGY
jgi:hypothetical protein